MARREKLREEGGVAHPSVAVAGAGVAGDDRGKVIRGGQSSGGVGFGATACRRMNRSDREALRVAAKRLDALA